MLMNNNLIPPSWTETAPQRKIASNKDMTRLEKFKVFLMDKYLIFRQCSVNTYYALVHLTLGVEEGMEFDEERLTDPETKHDKQEL